MEPTPVETLVNEFVAAYYTTFVYDPNNLYKFYSPEATISRADVTSAPLAEAKAKLVPSFPLGSEVNITKFYFCKVREDFLVNVTGHIVSEGVTSVLFQSLYVAVEEGRMSVLADHLTVVVTSEIISNDVELEVVNKPVSAAHEHRSRYQARAAAPAEGKPADGKPATEQTQAPRKPKSRNNRRKPAPYTAQESQ